MTPAMVEYDNFLATKRIEIAPSGFTPEALNPFLYPFQSDITRWGLERGKAAFFQDCGMGKTPQQLDWADHVVSKYNKPVLILAPLAVSKQTVREGEKFGIEAEIAIQASDVTRPTIYVTNYEKLHHFDPSVFAGVVLDECFPAGTMIDMVLGKCNIKDVYKGDLIWNASGIDIVVATKKRKIKNAIRITIGGQKIIASENHPFFTSRGYVRACELGSGDLLMETATAMRLVRGYSYSTPTTRGATSFLQSLLLSEMADEPSKISRQRAYTRSKEETRREAVSMAARRLSGGPIRDRAHSQSQPDVRSAYTPEGQSDFASDGARAIHSQRQRQGINRTAKDTAFSASRRMGTGSGYLLRQTTERLSNLLQGGYWQFRNEDSYRSRRVLPSFTESARQEKGCEADFIRVDSVEVLEQGHPELEKFKDADGSLYFYDIQAARHPSFSVNGCLVHNSSILKSFTGSTRNQLIQMFGNMPMRLACTATPAPNDYMELGNHSEFLGVLTRTEMLSTFFVHDGGDTSKWRLKGHAEEEYWRWVCNWAVMLRQPADLGYDDAAFVLPALKYHHHVVKSEQNADGFLFPTEAQTLLERRGARRASLTERVRLCAELVNGSTEPWLVWCDLNDEGDALAKLIPDAVQVAGRDKDEDKESRMLGFSEGKHRVLISKASICGWGMNWQHCANAAFVGLSDSWEQWYQAIRRIWRFGQTREVNCHVITSEAEGAVVRNIQRKEADAARMAKEMVKHMSVYNEEAVRRSTVRTADEYKTRTESGEGWTISLGDSVELIKAVPDDSVHYSIFSPPFASLYTYSASERDMGNARTHAEFYEHFRFLIAELYRVLIPGRLLSFHCMNLPTSKERDGVIGITDFRGELIRMFSNAGFIYHSETVIWKDPVTAMQRTKALGLLHKQLKKDSCMSRQGIPDYLVTMRKPGDNPERVTHTNESFPVSLWQRYASPVWFDINPSDTLQRESAREQADERHICPLQLQVIDRALDIWTNPADEVLDPFAGIGSTGYVALQRGRRFRGFELKESYFKQAVANVKQAANVQEQEGLFAVAD